MSPRQARKRSSETDQGKKKRSIATTAWNSTIPMIARMTMAPKASGVLKKAVEDWMR